MKVGKILKKKIYKILAATVALSVILTGCVGGGSKPKNAIAKVGKKYITAEDVNKQYYEVIIQYLQMGMNMPDESTEEGKEIVKTVREKIVEGIVFKEAKLEVAKKEKIKVTEEEVNAAIDENIKNAGGEDALKEFLKQEGITEEEFRKEQFTLFEENSYLTKLDEKLEKDNKPSKKEIIKFAEENKKDYFPVYNADHILYSINTDEGTPVADEEKAKIKAEAEALLKSMNSGEVKFYDKFGELVEKTGDDTEKTEVDTAIIAQPLGYFDGATMVEAFTNAVKDMKPETLNEAIVETEFGYHIIKLNEKITKLNDLDEEFRKDVEEKIKGRIVDEKISDLIEKEKKSLGVTYFNAEGEKVDSIEKAVKSFDFNKIAEEAEKEKVDSKDETKENTTDATEATENVNQEAKESTESTETAE